MGIIDKIKDKIKDQNLTAAKMPDDLFAHDRRGTAAIRPMTRNDVKGLVKNGIYLRCGANLMAKAYEDTVAYQKAKRNPAAHVAEAASALSMTTYYPLMSAIYDHGNMEEKAQSTAHDLAAFDEKGRPSIRKIPKKMGKELLTHPLVRMRCGAILINAAQRVMESDLNSRIPENTSPLKTAGMRMTNGAKAFANASKVYWSYVLDSSLLGYICNRAKEKFGEKKQKADVAALKAKTDGKDYM